MSLVTTKDLMLDAQKNHYAIGAFNAENMEMVQAIIAANSTGHPGDGKIFVMPVGESYVVRTGERTDA